MGLLEPGGGADADGTLLPAEERPASRCLACATGPASPAVPDEPASLPEPMPAPAAAVQPAVASVPWHGPSSSARAPPLC